MTTQGWKLKVLWRHCTESWMPLKDLKEKKRFRSLDSIMETSFGHLGKDLKEYAPVEVAEFAKARDLESDPAFFW